MTTAAIMDYDTVAGADKFGNVCLIRLPSDCNDDVEADDPSGNKVLWSGLNKNRDVRTGPLARPFARTAHSFACSGLLASLAPSAALTPLWARTTKNTDRSTGPLARPFACSLALLTCSLALPYSRCSRAPLRSLARSLARSLRSLPSSWDSD